MVQYTITISDPQNTELIRHTNKINAGPLESKFTPLEILQQHISMWLNGLVQDSELQRKQEFQEKYDNASPEIKLQIDALLITTKPIIGGLL